MSYDRAVYYWLISGLVLVYFQILIGGVTRLTGSGLSITKWEIVTGTLPPLDQKAWDQEFEKYKATPQYEKLDHGICLRFSFSLVLLEKEDTSSNIEKFGNCIPFGGIGCVFWMDHGGQRAG